ncbi:MAG TPA: heme-binding protein [Steroidobacteraceae bacterium]|nr:heme-binding protein [Steroidobacteraceae bacterium]
MTSGTALTVAALLTGLLGAVAGDAQQPRADAPAGAAANPLDTVPDKMPFDIPYGAPIPLARANAVIAAAVGEARKHDWKLNVAVVDSGANLVAFQRMDGAQLASIQVAQHKARSAATYRRETKAFENAIQSGNTYVVTLDGVIGSRGGIPLVEGGHLVGAIGCSGGTGSQDEVACKAGVAALNNP